MPYRVDIVGCADVGGASFANDGLRKLSPSYGPSLLSSGFIAQFQSPLNAGQTVFKAIHAKI